MPNNTMLYRMPGPHKLQDGLYDYRIVLDEDIDAALADGWFMTSPEAKAAYVAAQTPTSVPVVAEDAAPTRAELEQKARELNVPFDGRTSDKTLAAKIAEALKA